MKFALLDSAFLPRCLIAAAYAVLAFAVSMPAWGDSPRVAVWDPQVAVPGGRFPVSTDYLDRVSQWLRDGGISVQRLTAEQVADSAAFGADRFDALMLEGDAFPEIDIAAYQRFMENGGVLIALSAANPFYNKMAQDPQGLWRLSPENPNFVWQTEAINKALGIEFRYWMDMAYSAVRHAPTPLLETYLPQAKGWSLKKPLLARWYVATTGSIYPLLRSQQTAGRDYTPQMYLVANGKNRAIVCASKLFTGESDPKLWPWSRETVVAVARLAKDLHDGKVMLDKQLAVKTPTAVVLPGPLEVREAAPGIDPEQAQPVVRWGRFDGSRLDLGKTLAAGQTLKLPVGVGAEQVPGALEAGAKVELALPDLGAGPLYLRIRGAFAQTGAGLSAQADDTLLHNELLVYRLSVGTVNLSFHYKDAPNEFNRILYLPPSAGKARTLVISNPGTQTLFLDAIQIERRTKPARKMGLGLGNGVHLAFDRPTRLTPEICKDWSYFRCATRMNWIGPPDDPKRWDRYDKHVERYLALSPRVQLQLHGTPEWAAISAQRYESAGKQRPEYTPPDNEKFKEVIRRIVTKYAGRVEGWEIWNEQNITTFWMGTPEEYAALFHAVVPVIRECDPKATVIIGGLAGTVSGYVDQNAAKMVELGVTKKADLFGFHPYARNGVWDLPYCLFEGHLMNLGTDIEIYCNESGDNIVPWFGTPDSCSLTEQRIRLDRAMGRLFASGLAKLTVFNAGGDGDPYGLLDTQAQPRPAYSVFTDYLELAHPDGRRLDATLLSPDGKPIEGVYVAGASHDDGSVTLVVNPADVEAMIPSEDHSYDFTNKRKADWRCFFGKAEYETDKVTVTPGEKGYVGFYRTVELDPQAYPKIVVSVPQCAGKWSLTLKFSDGENVVLTDDSQAGEFTFAYLDKLKNTNRRSCETIFRIYGGPTTFAYVHFIASDTPRPVPQPIPVRVLAPLPKQGKYTAVARVGDAPKPVDVKIHSEQGQSWAQVDLSLTGRTVVTLKPEK
ncbi:MAG TPA: hypothetical protein DCX07_15435 [Phycisphaerales bacterium]|nr:hypothetical protein [Phycisphaerales bacterium]